MDGAELIRARFPDLANGTIEPMGDGWTCDTFVAGGEWIVQIPRSPYAAERLRAQASLLPELGREVSARIPEPEPASLDEEPPLLRYRIIAGVACDRAPHGIWPERLGRFLYDLHAVPPEIVGLRAITAAAVRERHRAECAALAPSVLPRLEEDDRSRAEAMLAAYLDDDDLWAFAPCLTHRDLGPEHVLVDPSGDLAGVIDWEEVDVGDPAVDFAWLLNGVPAQGERALAAYGGAPDRRFRERARYLHALGPWHEVRYGLEHGLEPFVGSGIDGVRHRLPDGT